MDRPQALVIFGPPGAGKGTQSSKLARYPDVHHLSSGALARDLPEGSDLHRRFTSALEATKRDGRYFPDALARDLLAHEIETSAYGIESLLVLDGIPRTEDQVGLVDEVVDVRAIIDLYAVDDEALVERMRRRDTRAYDTNERLALDRILEYRSKTEPAIEPYRSRGMLIFDVGALTGSPADIHEQITRMLISSELAGWFNPERHYKSI